MPSTLSNIGYHRQKHLEWMFIAYGLIENNFLVWQKRHFWVCADRYLLLWFLCRVNEVTSLRGGGQEVLFNRAVSNGSLRSKHHPRHDKQAAYASC